MAMPIITADCIKATVEKAAQGDPCEFATNFMLHLIETDQEATLMQLLALAQQFGGDDTIVHWKILATVGIVWKEIEATLEAKEMEVWQ